jgi:hypothetical protein
MRPIGTKPDRLIAALWLGGTVFVVVSIYALIYG